MTCTACGAAVAPTDRFCRECGQKLRAEAAGAGNPGLPAEGTARCFTGHSGALIAVSFSADGQHALSAGADNTMRRWDVASGRELHRFHVDAASIAAFSADGNYLLTSGGYGAIGLWNGANGQLLHRFPYTHTTDAMAVSADSRRAVFVTSEYHGVIDLASRRELRRSGRREDHQPACVAVSADGRRAIVGVSDPDYSIRAASVWDLDSGHELTAPSRAMMLVSCAAFSPDGSRAVAGSEDTSISLWDVASGRDLGRIEGHSGNIRSVAFTPDGRRLLSASGTDYYDADLLKELGIDNTMRLWDVETGRELCRFDGHTANVNCVAVSPDGRHALSGSADKTMRWWTLPA